MRWDVGIDLGTENVRMAVWKEGPVLDEAAMLAFREGHDTPFCGGNTAKLLQGRTCEGMTVSSPLKDGVLELTIPGTAWANAVEFMPVIRVYGVAR